MPLSTCNQKEFLIELKLKWIFGGFSVTFELRNVHREEER